MKTSRRHSRRTSLAEKPRLPAAFGAFPLCHSLPFLVPLLLEPAVNEGAHQGAGRDAAPEAVAAQAQVGLLFEPHGHRLVAQWAHRRPPAYTSSPVLAPPRQAPYVLDLGGATYLESMYPMPDPLYGPVLEHPRCWKLPSTTGTGTALPQAAPSATATSEPSLGANGITVCLTLEPSCVPGRRRSTSNPSSWRVAA